MQKLLAHGRRRSRGLIFSAFCRDLPKKSLNRWWAICWKPIRQFSWKKCTLLSETQMAGEKISKVLGNRRIWCHGNLHFMERVIRLEMTNDPMLHERCHDHPEVCRLDRLQGCMYTRGEEEQCAEQTVSSVGRSPLGPSAGRCKFPSKGFRGIVLTCCCSDPTHPTTPKSPGAVAHSFEFATRQLIQTLIP